MIPTTYYNQPGATPYTIGLVFRNDDGTFTGKDNTCNDIFIKGESQPAQTAKTMLDASARLTEEFPNITLPVLILHGTADKAPKPSGSQHFYEATGSTDKTLKLYEGHFHDLLNDVDKEVVMAGIQSWIDARISAEQSSAVSGA